MYEAEHPQDIMNWVMLEFWMDVVILFRKVNIFITCNTVEEFDFA